jgi:hypothetical protein
LQALADFLMGHLYMVILVIGLIYAMFFRKSPLERPPQNRPPRRPANRMPDFGGSPMFPAPRPPRRTEDPAGGRPDDDAGLPQPAAAWSEPKPVAAPAPSHPSRPEWADRPFGLAVEPEADNPARSGEALLAYEKPTAAQAAAAVRPAPPAEAAPVPETAGLAADEPRSMLSRDDLARAIVWAEVLGPPRARRPYRR